MRAYRRISLSTMLVTLGGFAATPARRSAYFLSDSDLVTLFDPRLTYRQIEERLGIRNARAYRYYWSAARRRGRGKGQQP
jgi:hypothetical protein